MLTQIAFVVFFLFKVSTSETPDELNKKITPENYEKSRELCANSIDSSIAYMLKKYINPENDTSVKFNFIEPCKVCFLEELKFKPIKPENIQAKFVDDDRLQSIVAISVENYRVTCRCQKNVSEAIIDEALAVVQREHVNSKCDKVTSNEMVILDTKKAKQCFIDALDKTKGDANSEPYDEMTMVGKHAVINGTTSAHDLKAADRNVTVLYTEININAPPTAHCDASRQDEEFCSCLHQSGFFVDLPVFMLNHLLSCGARELEEAAPHRHLATSLTCRTVIPYLLLKKKKE